MLKKNAKHNKGTIFFPLCFLKIFAKANQVQLNLRTMTSQSLKLSASIFYWTIHSFGFEGQKLLFSTFCNISFVVNRAALDISPKSWENGDNKACRAHDK